jgi:methane monooxygenase PmoA-like
MAPRILLALLCAMMLPALAGVSRTAESVTLVRHGNEVDVSIGGRPFTTYHFDSAEAKPYLQPLRTATGVIVTREFPIANVIPAEHQRDRSLEPHQRPMYFAHGNVNGFNFWAEEAFNRFYGQQTMPYGRTVFRELMEMKSGGDTGVLDAAFDLEGGGSAIGSEVQDFTFAGDASTRTIDCVFSLRADRGPLAINDTKEGTFAIRVAPELNSPPGRMVNARGGQGEPEIWGKPADWVNYDGTIGAEPVGIAIFDSPRNFRHPTTWHARAYGLFSANPFGLRAFTGDAKQDGTYRIPAGESLTLRYRVLIHTGDYQQAHVADAYRQYAARER